jgi:hypothetical protein
MTPPPMTWRLSFLLLMMPVIPRQVTSLAGRLSLFVALITLVQQAVGAGAALPNADRADSAGL